MKKYVFIAIGGALGAVSRFLVKGLDLHSLYAWLPLNTLIVNIAGCFLLALVLTCANEVFKMDEAIRLGIAVGFLGAFTTFSTLCRETAGLMWNGTYFRAIIYAAVSVILGLAAVYIGIYTAREVVAKLFARDKDDMDDSGLDTEGGVE